jgi:hypothetical protein
MEAAEGVGEADDRTRGGVVGVKASDVVATDMRLMVTGVGSSSSASRCFWFRINRSWYGSSFGGSRAVVARRAVTAGESWVAWWRGCGI